MFVERLAHKKKLLRMAALKRSHLSQPLPGERFSYIFIPSDMKKPMEERTESSEGGLEDDKLMSSLRSGLELGPTVDILALTVPTIRNDYTAVSLYQNGNPGNEGLEVNRRVNGLVAACGLKVSNEIRGDCVVSRYVDNDDDIWKRVNITAAECSSVCKDLIHTPRYLTIDFMAIAYFCSPISSCAYCNFPGR